MKFDVTVVVGKRETRVYEAEDAEQAREMAERGDEAVDVKWPHKEAEIVVVGLEQTALEPSDRAAKGLGKIMPRPGESDEESHDRVFGSDDEEQP